MSFLAIGKTGLSLSTELEGVIAREKEVSPRTIHRALIECVKAGSPGTGSNRFN